MANRHTARLRLRNADSPNTKAARNLSSAIYRTVGAFPGPDGLGDAPSGAPRSHPLTTSAPIRAQRADRREPVRYKRRALTAAGFGRLRERLQTDAPCAPDWWLRKAHVMM